MAQEVIRKHYEDLSVKKVRNAGRECNGIEDVLDNMDVLAKEQVKYGDEKTLWLDLTTKKLIARSIDPNCRIEIPPHEIIM